jgi:hypothetical protein
MIQEFTASLLSISTKDKESLSIDMPNLFSTFSSLPNSIFVNPKEVAAIAPPADIISDNGISKDFSSSSRDKVPTFYQRLIQTPNFFYFRIQIAVRLFDI